MGGSRPAHRAGRPRENFALSPLRGHPQRRPVSIRLSLQKSACPDTHNREAFGAMRPAVGACGLRFDG
jgi:hypothetical protein